MKVRQADLVGAVDVEVEPDADRAGRLERAACCEVDDRTAVPPGAWAGVDLAAESHPAGREVDDCRRAGRWAAGARDAAAVDAMSMFCALRTNARHADERDCVGARLDRVVARQSVWAASRRSGDDRLEQRDRQRRSVSLSPIAPFASGCRAD